MACSAPLCGQSKPDSGSDSTISGYDWPLPNAFGFNEGYGFKGGPSAKPLVELEMTRLSAELRCKLSWWTKYRDETILSKWREDALAQAKLMDESHVDYVLKELDGYANLRDEASGAEVSCYDKIWQSDTLIPSSLKERLIASAAKLEDVPESEKDWHPRSNGQVLDLYAGGSWHVEGMKNEAIAASSIYYYGEENITESRLAFRTAVAGPEEYEQDDERGCKLTWGMGRYDPCVNELGSVITCQDRCIAFPNTYQHCVSPFELADKSKPGHRKIVALFLVDPAIRRPSTTTVPPQQADWRASGIGANPVLKATFNKLSPEIIDHIDSMAEGTMTRKEANAYRLELMDERTAFVVKNDNEFFMAPFSLCEH